MDKTQEPAFRKPLLIFGVVAIVVMSVIAAALVAQQQLAPQDSSAAGPGGASCSAGNRVCYGQRYWICEGGSYGTTVTPANWRDAGTDAVNCSLNATECRGGHLFTCVGYLCGGTVWNADSTPDPQCQTSSTTGGGTTGGTTGTTSGTTGVVINPTTGTSGTTGTTGGTTTGQATRSSGPAVGPVFNSNLCYGGPSCDGKAVGTKIKLDWAGNTCTCKHRPNQYACGCVLDQPIDLPEPTPPVVTPTPIVPISIRNDGLCKPEQDGKYVLIACANKSIARVNKCTCTDGTCTLGEAAEVRDYEAGYDCDPTPEPASCIKQDLCRAGKPDSLAYCPENSVAQIDQDKSLLCNEGRKACFCTAYPSL